MRCRFFGSHNVLKPGRANRLDPHCAGGVRIFNAFPAQAVIYGRNHPCGDKHGDELDVPCTCRSLGLKSGVMHLTCPSIQSRSLSGRHVSTGFLDPVLGAMMKQVCWHSRRSKAYRGLPEARMAGATVEETAFEDVNMWQAPPPSWDVHFPTTWTTIP